MSRRLTRLRTIAGLAWNDVCDTGLGGHAGTYTPHNQLRHVLQESQEHLRRMLEGVDCPVARSTMTNLDLRHLLGMKAAQ